MSSSSHLKRKLQKEILYQQWQRQFGQPEVFLGNSYFVDGTNGSNNYDGQSMDQAKATITAAIVVSNADVAINTNHTNKIFIAGGQYTEDLTGASQCDLIGIDMNRRGWSPRIHGTLTCDSIFGMRLFNLALEADAAGDEAVIVESSHNFELHNCELRAGDPACTGFGVHLTTIAYYLKIVNCRFTNGWYTGVYLDGLCKAFEMYDCWVNASQNGIYVANGDASNLSFDGLVKNNVFIHSSEASDVPLVNGINLAGNSNVPQISFIDNYISATNCVVKGIDTHATFKDDQIFVHNHCIDASDGTGEIITSSS